MIPVLSHLFTDRRIQDFPELIHRGEADPSFFSGFLNQPHKRPGIVFFKTIETNNEIFHIQENHVRLSLVRNEPSISFMPSLFSPAIFEKT